MIGIPGQMNLNGYNITLFILSVVIALLIAAIAIYLAERRG